MRREISGGSAGLDLLNEVFNWGIRIGLLVLLAVTGYYVYWAYAAGHATAAQVWTAADYTRHATNMELLTKALLLATLVVMVSALGRYFNYPEVGGAVLAAGALFFFGMPFIIQNFGISGLADKRVQMLARLIEGRFQLSGLILLGAGGLFLLLHGFLLLVNLRHRRPQANAEAAKTAQSVRKKQDKFLGPCWELPFCRDTEKKLCPVRTAKKSCWRTGRGCYCDQNIILTISGGNQYSASRGSSGYLSRAATVVRPKSLREKREQCLQCPVYLHRQGQKYRFMTPAAIVAGIAGIAYYWEAIRGFYPNAMLALGRSMSGFSFGPTQGGVPAWAQDLATNSGMMWVIVGVAVLMIMAYLLQSVEWALYRLGI